MFPLRAGWLRFRFVVRSGLLGQPLFYGPQYMNYLYQQLALPLPVWPQPHLLTCPRKLSIYLSNEGDVVSIVWEYTKRDIPRRWLDAHKRQQKLHLKWRRDLKEIDKRETGKKVSRRDKGEPEKQSVS